MDDEAEILDYAFIDGDDMTIRDLGGRRLFFKNDMRPRARYLYFLFAVAQLKLAWRHDYHKDSTKVLKKQLGGGFWATKGCCLNRAFLLALTEEIGHDVLGYNIPMEPGDDNEPDETGIIGIAKLLQFQKRHFLTRRTRTRTRKMRMRMGMGMGGWAIKHAFTCWFFYF